MDDLQLEKVAEMFRVFSEKTRLAIIQELKGGRLSVNEVVERLETSQANISKQLKLLYDSGIVTRDRKGNQIFYGMNGGFPFEVCKLVCNRLNEQTAMRAGIEYSI